MSRPLSLPLSLWLSLACQPCRAVVLITRDPHLSDLIADRLLLVADGTVRPFEGDLNDYRALVQERTRAGAAMQCRDGGRRGGTARRPGRPWRLCASAREMQKRRLSG